MLQPDAPEPMIPRLPMVPRHPGTALFVASLVGTIAAAFTQARANDNGAAAPPPPAEYSLLNPTPDSALRPLSTDRPPRSNSPITVDAGHFQVESDLANFTYDNTAGVKTRTFEALDPSYKLGLTNWADLEVQFNGLQSISTGNNLVPTMHEQGFGDVFLRGKVNFIGNDSGDLAIAAIPYVKVPSNRPVISNGAVEGGVIVPITYKLPSDFVLLLDPEFAVLKNATDNGRHATFTNLINLSHPVPGIKDLTVSAEFYASVSAERASPDIYTADFALAYLVTPRVQLDLGTIVGLNRAAPARQVFFGISVKF